MAITVAPIANFTQFFDNDGFPLAGGKIFTYEPGSFSNLKTTYNVTSQQSRTTDPVPNENPIVLDSSGRVPTSIWIIQNEEYHFVLTQADGTTVLDNMDYILGPVTVDYINELILELDDKFLPIAGGTVVGSFSVLGNTLLKNTTVEGTLRVTGASTLAQVNATSVTATLNANGQPVTNVGAPTVPTDAATKGYVDSSIIQGIPAGAVFYTAAAGAPTGYLIANGDSVQRTVYSALFSAIGTTYGSVDGNTFNLPDLRGTFIRGLDLSRGLDPSRTLGSPQAPAVQKHKHAGAWGEAGGGPFGNSNGAGKTGSNRTDSDNFWWWTNDGTDADGPPNPPGVIADETRPVNIALTPIIKT